MKTCTEHKEYYTGCTQCQHDCIDELEVIKYYTQEFIKVFEVSIILMNKDYYMIDRKDVDASLNKLKEII